MAALNFLSNSTGNDNTAAFERLADRVLGAQGRTTTQSSPNSANRIFDEFVRQTQQREELLVSATKEQIKIFNKLEQTLQDMKSSSSQDFTRLSKSLSLLSARLNRTESTPARQNIKTVLDSVRPGLFTAAAAPAALQARTQPQRNYERSALQPAATATATAFAGAGLMGSEESTEPKPNVGVVLLGGLLDKLLNLIMTLTGGKMIMDAVDGLFGRGGKDKKTGTRSKPTSRTVPAPETTGPGNRNKPTRTPGRPGTTAAGGIFNKIKGGIGRAAGAIGTGILGVGSMLGNAKLLTGLGALTYSSELGSGELWTLNEKGERVMTPEALKALEQPGITPAAAPSGQGLNTDQLTNNALQTQMQTNPAPVIINNQTTPVVKTPAPTFIGPTQSIRPTESTLIRYQNRESFY